MCIFVGRETRESHLKCGCEACLLVILFSTGIENPAVRFWVCQVTLPHMVLENSIAMLFEKGFLCLYNLMLNIMTKMQIISCAIMQQKCVCDKGVVLSRN